MSKGKKIYFGILLLSIIMVSTIYFSYAFFTNLKEEHGKLNIVAGTLDYQLESSELINNQVTVGAKQTKIFPITIKNLNDIDFKYELYYKIEDSNNVVVSYLENPSSKGTLEKDSKITVEIMIENNSDMDKIITFGLERGFIHNALVLTGTEKALIAYCEMEHIYAFDYVGKEQQFTTLCSGNYKVELWGAQGGSIDSYKGGLGSYTKGNINLAKNQTLYIYVGEQGNQSGNATFNNGCVSNLWADKTAAENNIFGMPGGGATDMRLVNSSFDGLKSRIMVAAGGSGASNYYHPDNGVAGGGLTGYDGKLYGTDGIVPTGGTQTSGGLKGGGLNSTNATSGSFGRGGQAMGSVSSGGSGYYGGGSGPHGTGTVGIGASGSSFISGHNGCNAILETSTENNIQHSNQSIHYSGLFFTDTVMIDGEGYQWTTSKQGNIGMPSYDGKNTIIGNAGNGYAKITYLGK